MRIDPILNIEPSTTQADSFPIAKNRGYAGEFTVDTDEHWLSTSIPAGNSIRIYGAGNSDTVYLDAYVAAETAARFSGQLQGFSQSIQIDNERSQSVEVQLLMTTDTPQSYWILCEEVRS